MRYKENTMRFFVSILLIASCVPALAVSRDDEILIQGIASGKQAVTDTGAE